MADVLLTVGVDVENSYKEFADGINELLGRINKDKHEIKVTADVEEAKKNINELLDLVKELNKQELDVKSKNNFAKIFESNSKSITTFEENLKRLNKELKNNKTTPESNGFSKVVSETLDSVEELKKTISSFDEAAEGFESSNKVIVKNIADSAKSIPEIIDETSKEIGKNISENIESNVTKIKKETDNASKEISNAIQSNFTGKSISKEIGNDTADEIKNSIESTIGQIKESSIVGDAGKEIGKTVGENIVEGLEESVKNSVPQIVDSAAAENLVRKIFAKAEELQATLRLSTSTYLESLPKNWSNGEDILSAFSDAIDQINSIKEIDKIPRYLRTIDVLNDRIKKTDELLGKINTTTVPYSEVKDIKRSLEGLRDYKENITEILTNVPQAQEYINKIIEKVKNSYNELQKIPDPDFKQIEKPKTASLPKSLNQSTDKIKIPDHIINKFLERHGKLNYGFGFSDESTRREEDFKGKVDRLKEKKYDSAIIDLLDNAIDLTENIETLNKIVDEVAITGKSSKEIASKLSELIAGQYEVPIRKEIDRDGELIRLARMIKRFDDGGYSPYDTSYSDFYDSIKEIGTKNEKDLFGILNPEELENPFNTFKSKLEEYAERFDGLITVKNGNVWADEISARRLINNLREIKDYDAIVDKIQRMLMNIFDVSLDDFDKNDSLKISTDQFAQFHQALIGAVGKRGSEQKKYYQPLIDFSNYLSDRYYYDNENNRYRVGDAGVDPENVEKFLQCINLLTQENDTIDSFTSKEVSKQKVNQKTEEEIESIIQTIIDIQEVIEKAQNRYDLLSPTSDRNKSYSNELRKIFNGWIPESSTLSVFNEAIDLTGSLDSLKDLSIALEDVKLNLRSSEEAAASFSKIIESQFNIAVKQPKLFDEQMLSLAKTLKRYSDSIGKLEEFQAIDFLRWIDSKKNDRSIKELGLNASLYREDTREEALRKFAELYPSILSIDTSGLYNFSTKDSITIDRKSINSLIHNQNSKRNEILDASNIIQGIQKGLNVLFNILPDKNGELIATLEQLEQLSEKARNQYPDLFDQYIDKYRYSKVSDEDQYEYNENQRKREHNLTYSNIIDEIIRDNIKFVDLESAKQFIERYASEAKASTDSTAVIVSNEELKQNAFKQTVEVLDSVKQSANQPITSPGLQNKELLALPDKQNELAVLKRIESSRKMSEITGKGIISVQETQAELNAAKQELELQQRIAEIKREIIDQSTISSDSQKNELMVIPNDSRIELENLERLEAYRRIMSEMSKQEIRQLPAQTNTDILNDLNAAKQELEIKNQIAQIDEQIANRENTSLVPVTSNAEEDLNTAKNELMVLEQVAKTSREINDQNFVSNGGPIPVIDETLISKVTELQSLIENIRNLLNNTGDDTFSITAESINNIVQGVNRLVELVEGLKEIKISFDENSVTSMQEKIQELLDSINKISTSVKTTNEQVVESSEQSAQAIEITTQKTLASAENIAKAKAALDNIKIRNKEIDSGYVGLRKNLIGSDSEQNKIDLNAVESKYTELREAYRMIGEIGKSPTSEDVNTYSSQIAHIQELQDALQSYINTVKERITAEQEASKAATTNKTTKAETSSNLSKDDLAKVAELKASIKELRLSSNNIGKTYQSLDKQLTASNTESDIEMLENLKAKYMEFQTAMESLKNVDMKTPEGLSDANEQIKNVQKLKEEVQNYINIVKEKIAADKQSSASSNENTSSTLDEEKVLNQYIQTLNKLESALKNSSAAKNSSNESSKKAYNAMEKDLDDLKGYYEAYRDQSITLDEFADQIEGIKKKTQYNSATINQNGDNSQSLFQHLGNLASRFTQWFSVSQIIMYAVNSIRQMVTASIELDTAMTELKKVTDESNDTYNNFLENASERATTLGASLSDVVTSTADFARLGYDIEEASELADVATIYKNVGDGISNVSEASSSIIATLQAFGIEASDAMSIVDKFNAVGNNYAISSGGIGEALLRSAAAMKAANNTLDETIALTTAANTIVQDPQVVGTTMKTVSMFLRAAKTEAEEAGESTEGMASSVSELRDEILALTGNRVDIQIDDNTFKSTYQILKELSEVWGSLTDISQANILEMIGGKRNANVISALLKNFSIAEEALQTSSNAEGSAIEENEKYLDSVQGKINVMKASFQALSDSLVSGDLISFFVEAGTKALNMADTIVKVTNTFGGLKTVLLTLGEVFLAANVNNIFGAFSKIVSPIQNAITVLSQFISKLRETHSLFEAFGSLNANTLLTGLSAVIGVVIAAWNTYKNAQKEKLEEVQDAAFNSDEFQNSIQGQIDKIRELRTELDSGNLTESEAYQVKSQLLEIQQQLTESYGQQVDGIDLVNDGLGEQIDLLDEVSRGEAAKYLNENDEEIEKAEKELAKKLGGKEGYYLSSLPNDDSALSKRLDSIVNKYSDYLSTNAFNDVYFNGNAEQAEKVLNNLLTDIHDAEDEFGSSDALSLFEEFAERGLKDADDTLEKYRDIAEQAAEDRLIADADLYTSNGKSQTAINWIRDYASAIKEYNEALSSGDQHRINDAAESFDEVDKNIQGLVSGDMSEYSDQIQEIRGQLDDAAISANNFFSNLEDKNGFYKSALDTIKEADLKDIDFESLIESKGNGDVNKAIRMIANAADEAGVSVDELISKLIELDVINNEGTKTPEATSTFESIMQDSSENSFAKSIDNFQSRISDVQSTIDSLNNNEDVNLTELFAQFPELAGKTDTLTDSLQALSDIKLSQVSSMVSSFVDQMGVLSDPSEISKLGDVLSEILSNIDLSGIDFDKFQSDVIKNLFPDAKNVSAFSDTLINNFDPSVITDSAVKAYSKLESVLSEFNALGLKNPMQTVFGNVDTNNRQIIGWNKDSLETYKKELQSWNAEAKNSWETFAQEMEGTYSTVYGMSGSFDGIEIAFTPILQTDQGAELLSKSTVYDYINGLISAASTDGEWTNEELLSLDAKGMEVDGKKISGIIADIGDEASKTGEAIDFTGDLGTIADAYRDIELEASKAGISAEELVNSIEFTEDVIGDLGDDTQGAVGKIAALKEVLQAFKDASVDLTFNIDKMSVDKFLSDMSEVQSALSSQKAGTSISLDTYNSEGLKDYREALEYVNGTMQLNVDKVNELVAAKADEQLATIAENKALAQSKYLENARQVEKLRDTLRNNESQLGASEEAIRSQISKLLEENSVIASNCTQYDIMASSIENATSAYQNWINAQNAPQSGEIFDSALTAFQRIDDTINNTKSDYYGRTGNADYKAALDFVIPESVDRDDQAAVNSYIKSIQDYFTYDENGGRKGLDIQTFCQSAIDAGLMVLDESSQEYKIAGERTMEEFAEGLNLSLPFVEAIFGEMEEFDGHFTWKMDGTESLQDLGVSAYEAAESLRELDEFKDLRITMDVSGFEDETAISTLESTIEEMNKVKATPGIDTSEIENANAVIRYCVAQIQAINAPVIMQVDTSRVQGEIGAALDLLKEFQTAQNKVEMDAAVGADTSEAETEVNSLAEKVRGLNPEIKAKLGLDTTNVETIKASIQGIGTDALIKAGVDQSLVDEFVNAEHKSKGTVSWDNNKTLVDKYISQVKHSRGVVDWSNDTSKVKTSFSAVGHVRWDNTSPQTGKMSVNGTAHASGTANAGGNWGTASGGKTLVGELGREIVVDPKTGKWYTVGDNGAEMVNIPKNAIVFNHLQTESILKDGYVTGRGLALASGTALAGGRVSGGISVGQADKSTKHPSSGSSSSQVSGNMQNAANSSKEVADNAKETEKTSEDVLEKFKEWFSSLFDWIEIRLEKGQKKIDKFVSTAESAVDEGNFKKATDNYRNAISAVMSQIMDQQTAASKYTDKANTVLEKAIATKGSGITRELADKIKTQVANGSMDIEEYNENIQEVISSYQEWISKAEDAQSAIDDLHDSLKEYTDALKENADAKRDATLDRIDVYSSVGGSFYAYSYGSQVSQLNAANLQLRKQNKAYAYETKSVKKNVTSATNNANSSINSARKSATGKYAEALKSAQDYINKGLRVPADVLETISANNRGIYEQLYAYNLALDTLEIARREEALNYASTSADRFENVASRYKAKDDKINDRIDLLQKVSENRVSTKNKNNVLDKVSKQYDKQLANDQAEVKRFSGAQKQASKKIKDYTGHGAKFKSISAKTRETVSSYIKAAKKAAKSNKTIPAKTLSVLAQFVSKGYVSEAFYNSCVDYNNALQRRKEAEDQFEIDKQTVAQEKASLGRQKIENLQQKYENKRNGYNAEFNKVGYMFDMIETKGGNLSAKDYQIQMKEQQKLLKTYQDEADSIRKQNAKNVAEGLYKKGSQDYKDMEQAAVDAEKSAYDCSLGIQELQNTLDTLNITKLEEINDVLSSMLGYLESVLSMVDAAGKYQDKGTYERIITKSYEQYQNYKDQAEIDRANWEKATVDPSGGFGGKSANEWLTEMYDDLAKANQAMADVYENQKAMKELPLVELTDELENLESIFDVLTSEADLKEAEGHYLHTLDFQKQIAALQEQIAKQELINEQNRMLYEDAVARGADADAAEYFDAWKSGQASVNDMKSNIEELNDKIRDDFVDSVRRAIDAINDVRSIVESEVNLKEAQGKYLDASDYYKQIDVNTQEYEKQQQVMADRYAKYNEALIAGNEAEADQMLSEARQAEAASNDLLAANEKLQKSIQNLFKDSIERDLDALESLQDVIESEVNLKESQSRDLTREDYQTQIDSNMDMLLKQQALARENQRLYNLEVSKGNMASAAEYFKDWKNAEATANQLKADIEELGDAIRENLLTKDMDKVLDRLEQFRNAVTTLADLVTDDMMYADGKLTEFGIMSLAMNIKEYESDTDSLRALLEKRKRYIEEYNEGMNKYYSRNEFDEDMKTVTKDIQDMLKNASNARQAIVQMVTQTSKAEVDALLDVIEKRKKLLEAQKDTADFDKTLKQKTNDLAILQKQKEALEGLTDKESLAKLQKLNKQIADAQEALDETLSDHAYNLNIAGLDDLKEEINEAYERYVQQLNDNLASITDAVQSATDTVTGSLGVVEEAIKKLLDSYGVEGLDKESVGYSRQYASGTRYHPGGSAILNERGPEIVTLPNGSVLIPALPKGAGVINSDMTKNLIDMAKYGKNITTSGLSSKDIRSLIDKSGSDVNMGDIEVGGIHIYDATDPDNVMEVINKNIKTIAKSVGTEFGKNVSKIGSKKNFG